MSGAAQSALPFKTLSMLDIDEIEVTDSNVHVIATARMRLLEAQTLIAMASGTHVPISLTLMPLARAVDSFLDDADKQNTQPLDDGPHLEDQIMLREKAAGHLDNARIAAVSMMAHLDQAVRTTYASNKLAGDPSTNG